MKLCKSRFPIAQAHKSRLSRSMGGQLGAEWIDQASVSQSACMHVDEIWMDQATRLRRTNRLNPRGGMDSRIYVTSASHYKSSVAIVSIHHLSPMCGRPHAPRLVFTNVPKLEFLQHARPHLSLCVMRYCAIVATPSKPSVSYCMQ